MKRALSKIFIGFSLLILFCAPTFGNVKTTLAEFSFFDPLNVSQTVSRGWEKISGETITDSVTKSATNGVLKEVGSKVGEWAIQILAYVTYAILTLSAFYLGIAGIILNFVILKTVVGIKELMDSITAINSGWTLLRDLGNSLFIFILLYLGISTVLGLNEGKTKIIIRNVIIIGLLVNFSLFFTKVLIDASNIPSLFFYNKITADKFADGNGVDQAKDFSGKFMESLGITSFFDTDSKAFVAAYTAGGYAQWQTMFIKHIGGSIIMFITAVTFTYGALLFIIRFIVLVALLILSPIAYFGLILPGTATWAKKWWNLLTGQLVFAPVYMLFMYLVLVLAQGMSGQGNGGSQGLSGLFDLTKKTVDGANSAIALTSAGTITPAQPQNAFGMIFSFAVIIGFMILAGIISTSIATNTGGAVGGMLKRMRGSVIGTGKWMGKKAVDAGKSTARVPVRIGGAGLSSIGRNTLGARAYHKLNSDEGKELKRRADEGDESAKLELKKLDARASADYSLGNTRFGKALGLKATDNGGYKKRYETQKVKTNSEINRIGTMDQTHIADIETARGELKAAEDAYNAAAAMPLGVARDAQMKTTATNLKTAQGKLDNRKHVAQQHVTQQRMQYAAGVLNNPGASHAQKAAAKDYMKKVRTTKPSKEEAVAIKEAQLRDQIASGAVTATDISNAERGVIKDLPGEILSNPLVMPNLTKDQLEAIRQNTDNKLNPTQKAALVAHLRAQPAGSPIANYLSSNNGANSYWS